MFTRAFAEIGSLAKENLQSLDWDSQLLIGLLICTVRYQQAQEDICERIHAFCSDFLRYKHVILHVEEWVARQNIMVLAHLVPPSNSHPLIDFFPQHLDSVALRMFFPSPPNETDIWTFVQHIFLLSQSDLLSKLPYTLICTAFHVLTDFAFLVIQDEVEGPAPQVEKLLMDICDALLVLLRGVPMTTGEVYLN